MPECIEKFSREQARALWCIFFPGTDDQVRNFNAYITEYKKLDTSFAITVDEWIEFQGWLSGLTRRLVPVPEKMAKLGCFLKVYNINI